MEKKGYSMRLLSAFLTFSLCSTSLLATGQSVHRAQQGFKPAIIVKSNRIEYPAAAASLAAVDFRNLDYKPYDGPHAEIYQVRNGKYESHEEFGGETLTVEKVWLFGQQGGDPGFALVFLDDFSAGGSSSDGILLLLFTVQDGRLAQLQRLEADRQASGTGVTFTPATKSLVVKARSNDDSPHCCPKHIDLIHLNWTAAGFTVASTQRLPSK